MVFVLLGRLFKAYTRLLLDDELGELSLSRGVGESFSECIVGFAKEAQPKTGTRGE